MLTVAETSRLIGKSEGYVRKLLRSRQIKGEPFGHAWKVDRRSAEAWKQKVRKPGPKPKLVRPQTRTEGGIKPWTPEA